jgi:hypothetical protein
VPFAECGTWQSLCRVFFGLCRVPPTLSKSPASGSATFQVIFLKWYRNFKISQHESCPKLKTLQLCFLNQNQIPISFEIGFLNFNLNLGFINKSFPNLIFNQWINTIQTNPLFVPFQATSFIYEIYFVNSSNFKFKAWIPLKQHMQHIHDEIDTCEPLHMQHLNITLETWYAFMPWDLMMTWSKFYLFITSRMLHIYISQNTSNGITHVVAQLPIYEGGA